MEAGTRQRAAFRATAAPVCEGVDSALVNALATGVVRDMLQDTLNAPHGGLLVNLLVDADRRKVLQQESKDFPSWDLTPRQVCDLELLMNGGFSPLTGFMGRKDYESVCNNMRLANGTLWPIPITLDVTEAFAQTLKP